VSTYSNDSQYPTIHWLSSRVWGPEGKEYIDMSSVYGSGFAFNFVGTSPYPIAYNQCGESGMSTMTSTLILLLNL
jgi:hypothetical protein